MPALGVPLECRQITGVLPGPFSGGSAAFATFAEQPLMRSARPLVAAEPLIDRS